MKKLLLMFTIGALLYSCTTKSIITRDQTADTLVKHYLDTTLNDPGSYESVKFEKIDTIFTTYFDDDGYNSLPKSSSEIQLDDIAHHYDLYQKRTSNGYYDKVDKLQGLAIDSLKKVHTPKMKYLNIEHTFRAKNGFNALIVHSMGFTIDTGLTKVVSVYNVKE